MLDPEPGHRGRRVRRRRPQPAVGTTLKLLFRRPYSWKGMLAFFALRAIPGVEEVDGDVYRRVIAAGEGSGLLEVRPSPGEDALLASVQLPECVPLMPLVGRLRHVFDLACLAPQYDINGAGAQLAARLAVEAMASHGYRLHCQSKSS